MFRRAISGPRRIGCPRFSGRRRQPRRSPIRWKSAASTPTCGLRILFWTTIGYGTFYFVRKNLSIALPIMQDQLGLSKSSMGLILTLHGVLYGVSKFLNGVAADRANARLFMALALIISAGLNVCFGLSSALVFFGLFWMLNGWFQGMGYPPWCDC